MKERRKMRKLFALILTLAVLQVPAFPASAETVTAMATEPYMETYAAYACYAKILRYDNRSNMLEIALMIPEIFRRDDIRNLAPGDAIYTGGREVAVKTVNTEEDGTFLLNRSENGEYSETEVRLYEDEGGNYRTVSYITGTDIMNEADRIRIPVKEDLVFLDMNDPEGRSYAMPDLPAVHTAAEFLEIYSGEGPESFSDLYVVFDADGELAVVYRLYTPW